MKKGSVKHQCGYCGNTIYLQPVENGIFAQCKCGAEYKSAKKGGQVFTLKMGDQSQKMYMNLDTGSVDTRDGWDYEDEAGETVNAVDLGDQDMIDDVDLENHPDALHRACDEWEEADN